MTKLAPSHTLNIDITLIELLRTLKKLQRNKAIGLDGMKAKFILDARKLLHMPPLITFNCYLEEGFLKALSIGMFRALCKRDDAFKFDNYKGLS